MHDHELTIRMRELQARENANDKKTILEAYNQAFVDGFDRWFKGGMNGSAMTHITDLMQQRGVIK